jgi:menaquinone C8-methyltransferase
LCVTLIHFGRLKELYCLHFNLFYLLSIGRFCTFHNSQEMKTGTNYSWKRYNNAKVHLHQVRKRQLIPDIAGWITRHEGKKFLRLEETFDESRLTSRILRPNEQISLYIHIPFCRKLCPFCCFNRYLFKEDEARAYFRYLKKELDCYIRNGFQFTHFYIGGGTPTVLMDELLDFIQYLHARFKVKEISLETTPAEISQENITRLKSAGIKRLSIGVQSFDDKMLQSMGRTLCTGEQTREKLLMAQGQFSTLNIDLIFNFPFQTLESFRNDVAAFKKMGIDQVTFYPLMPSPHKKSALERKFSRVDNSGEKKYYDIILKDIFAQGYEASTVWCFSKGNLMIDEYIVDYADYIGIGSGSVSLVNGYFYVNTFSLQRYAEMLKNDHFPIARWRKLSEKEYLRYYLLTKLFGMKIDSQQFREDFKADIHRKLGNELLALKLAGAISDHKEIRITPKGMYTVSVMMREFFASLNTLREYCIEKQI